MNTLLNKLFSKDLFTKMVLTLSLVLGATQAWGDKVIFNGSIADGWTLTTGSGADASLVNSEIYSSSKYSSGLRLYSSDNSYPISSGETIVINARKMSSLATDTYIKVYYYNEAWVLAKTINVEEFSTSNADLPEIDKIVGNYRIKFEICQAYVHSITLKQSGTLSISPDEAATFGNVTTDTSKEYTITNNTASAVTITPSIIGSNLFTVSPSSATEITSGSSQVFTVAFDWQANVSLLDVEKTATITLAPSNGMSNFTINASATEQVALTLDETSSSTITTGMKSILVKYNPQNKWNTICMPFTLYSTGYNPVNYMDVIFGEGWKAYQLTSCENGVLTFSKQTTTLGAGYPYLVYIDTAPVHTDGVVIEANPTYTSPRDGITQGNATFQGTFARIDAPGMLDKYGITTAGKLGKGNKDAWIKGYRAYIEMSDPDPEVRPTIVFDDEEGGTTDLGFIKMVDPEAKDVYTLSGQKVEKAGKGIYIVNGRKVVIK